MATNYQKIFSKQGGYIANWDVYWSGGVVNVEQVSSNGDVLGRLDIISDQLSSIESSIQDTNDLLREAEENRQREREEEQQMGDDAADGGNGIFSLLSGLSILNPFGAFFDFTDGCRDISGLGNFLSLSPENHTICPFFPASVRNVVSPIVGVFTIVLVFTFAWSILGADSSKMSKV
ncbi:hypothetical protein FWH13_02135 [Candidatus Saccharibacteria bacterium]|nr:hypothetical protein [Candidatus Saccharibacteria bacterium]